MSDNRFGIFTHSSTSIYTLSYLVEKWVMIIVMSDQNFASTSDSQLPNVRVEKLQRNKTRAPIKPIKPQLHINITIAMNTVGKS